LCGRFVLKFPADVAEWARVQWRVSSAFYAVDGMWYTLVFVTPQKTPQVRLSLLLSPLGRTFNSRRLHILINDLKENVDHILANIGPVWACFGQHFGPTIPLP